jgi:septum formation protein
MSILSALSPITLSKETINPVHSGPVELSFQNAGTPEMKKMAQLRPLVLASASPRREQLLREAGLLFEIDAPPPEEEENGADKSLPPEERVKGRARAKAAWAAERHPEAVVLGADTVVVLEGEEMGKPGKSGEARKMLVRLSGRKHDVMTGFALAFDGNIRTFVVRTEVRFRVLDDESIGRYVATEEPMDKAGAYAIQGAGGSLIDSVRGSYTNVVGLPLPEVLSALADCGVLGEESPGP